MAVVDLLRIKFYLIFGFNSIFMLSRQFRYNGLWLYWRDYRASQRSVHLRGLFLQPLMAGRPGRVILL